MIQQRPETYGVSWEIVTEPSKSVQPSLVTLSGAAKEREIFKRRLCPTSMQMVKSMNLTIRDLNESVFRKFKAKAVGEGMKLGQALTQAMEIWIRQSTDKRDRSLLNLETFDWGKGTEKTSVEIDKNIYG
jgi:hypothetical protein